MSCDSEDEAVGFDVLELFCDAELDEGLTAYVRDVIVGSTGLGLDRDLGEGDGGWSTCYALLE